jgi:hypothetical protein
MCVKGVICMVVVESCSYVTRGVITLVGSWLTCDQGCHNPGWELAHM